MPTSVATMLTAEEIMKHNPVSVAESATLGEAAAFLIDHGFTAAPVINDHGHAIGVVSVSDLLRHDRSRSNAQPRRAEYYEWTNLEMHPDEPLAFKLEHEDTAKVRDVMSHAVYAVKPNAPLDVVIEIMLDKNVHRLFVTDAGGTLVGVISTFDVLRKLAARR